MLASVSPELQISYEEAGRGPPLVLLHAFPQARAMWRCQLEVLSSDFRVLCPDLPGFGESRSASPCSIEGMADDIVAWLKYLQIDRAIVGGASMGGYVALALARRHPQLLRGLILASTRADADSDEARAGREAMIAFARDNDARAVFEKMAPRLFCPVTRRDWPELIEEAARIAEPIPRSTIVSTLQALRDRPDARGSLASITAPTLVLVGKSDEVSPPALAREMMNAIPNVLWKMLRDAGHFAHVEAEESWSRTVRDWARQIS